MGPLFDAPADMRGKAGVEPGIETDIFVDRILSFLHHVSVSSFCVILDMYNNEQCVFVVCMYIVNMWLYNRTLCIRTRIQLSQMVTTAVSQCLSTYRRSFGRYW